MDHRLFKQESNEQFARIAKAVANAHRIELLDLLAQGERTVEQLSDEAALTVANTSQHLQSLRNAHLVVFRKEGLYVYYRLSDPTVYRLIQVIRDIAEHQLAEVNRIIDTYLTNRSELEPLSLNELSLRLLDPELTILDVRPGLEYNQGHLPGARSIPVEELATRLHELSVQQEIVAYCRGPYCVFADEAVDILTENGYRARRMHEGYPDWCLSGLPIEMSEQLN